MMTYRQLAKELKRLGCLRPIQHIKRMRKGHLWSCTNMKYEAYRTVHHD